MGPEPETAERERKRRRRSRVLTSILAFALAAVLLASSAYRWQFRGPLSADGQAWGVFGDFLGGLLNPILSFLALGALLWTIHLQTEELEETREEAKGSRKALEAQLFEGRFSTILRIHSDFVRDMRTVDWRGDVHQGAACFHFWLGEFDLSLSGDYWWIRLGANQIRDRWERLLKEYASDLLPFFRNVEAILKIIAQRPLDDRNLPRQEEYMSLLRSFFSDAQLDVLWLWRHGGRATAPARLQDLLGDDYALDPFTRSPLYGVRGALLRDEETGDPFLASDEGVFGLEPKPCGECPRMITALFWAPPTGKTAQMDSHVEETFFPSVSGALIRPAGHDTIRLTDSDGNSRTVVPCNRETFELLRDINASVSSPSTACVFYRDLTPEEIHATSIVTLMASLDELEMLKYRSALFTAIQSAKLSDD